MKLILPLALLPAFLVAACNEPEGRGGLTAEEERQLDEAARMLEENVMDVAPDDLVLNESELETLEAPPVPGEGEAAEPAG